MIKKILSLCFLCMFCYAGNGNSSPSNSEANNHERDAKTPPPIDISKKDERTIKEILKSLGSSSSIDSTPEENERITTFTQEENERIINEIIDETFKQMKNTDSMTESDWDELMDSITKQEMETAKEEIRKYGYFNSKTRKEIIEHRKGELKRRLRRNLPDPKNHVGCFTQ